MFDDDARPHLPNHVVLRHDKGRDRWVLLAPERVLTPDPVAVDVLKLCDGKRTIAEIITELAREYQAPAGQISADVTKLLADLKDKGIIVT
jgi:pyrroloquinoline quinone biosynthesis protein D